MFLCGSREYDELTLCDALASLATVITTLCKQGGKGQWANEAVSLFLLRIDWNCTALTC